MDALVLRSDNSSIAKDIRKEMGALNRQILKTKKKAEIREARQQLRRLTKEEKKRQAKVSLVQTDYKQPFLLSLLLSKTTNHIKQLSRLWMKL